MQIDQKRRAPLAANALKLLRQKFVVWAVDIIDPRIQFLALKGTAPDLAKAGQAARHETKTTSRAAI